MEPYRSDGSLCQSMPYDSEVGSVLDKRKPQQERPRKALPLSAQRAGTFSVRPFGIFGSY